MRRLLWCNFYVGNVVKRADPAPSRWFLGGAGCEGRVVTVVTWVRARVLVHFSTEKSPGSENRLREERKSEGTEHDFERTETRTPI